MYNRWIGVVIGGLLTLTGCGANRKFPRHASQEEVAAANKPPYGHIDAKQIQRVVHEKFPAFRRCYESELRIDPNIHGRIYTYFVIERDGAVGHLAFLDAPSETLPQITIPRFEKCVADAFESLVFPKPDGGIVTVTYPIIFDPGD